MTQQEAFEGYPIAPEDLREITRLLTQGQIFTQATEGSVRDLQQQFPHTCRMLDLGCGPGELVLSVAIDQPGWSIIGVDNNPLILDFAEHKRRADRLSNVAFKKADITQPLPFADASFDLVFARALVGVLGKQQWEPLLQECYRLLRPGGLLRLIEAEWGIFSGSATAYLDQLIGLMFTAWHRAGRSFSPNGSAWAITARLAGFVERAGFKSVEEKAFTVNYSREQPAHESAMADYQSLFSLMKPFVLKFVPELSEKRYDDLFVHAQDDMASSSEDFYGRGFILQVTASRPA